MPTPTKYPYSIANDFSSGANTTQLAKAISASAIVTAFDHIETTGDVLDVWFRDSLSTTDKTTLDNDASPPTTGSLIGDHDGSITLVDDITEYGIQRMNISPGKPGLKMVVVGRMFTASLNQTTDDDVSFAEERELQGAWLQVSDHTPGDYVELFAVHPMAGVVGQFGETIYIPPDGIIPPANSEGVEVIPAGIKLRLSYTSVAASGTAPEVYGYFRMRK